MANLSDILTNYQSVDTLDSVTGRGATTTNAITIGNLTSTGIDDNATSTAITISSTGDTTLDGNFTMTSTDAGSAAAPEIDLFRNSASPADADYLGQIKFTGKQDGGGTVNYAKITGKILDASNGTEDGILEFMLRKAGSNNIAARFRSDRLDLINGTNLTVSDGNVGVGTNSPSSPNGFSRNLTISGSSCSLALDETDFNTWEMITSSGSFRIYDETNERMRIDSSGNVGIGTTNPTSKLQVEGTVAVAPSSTGGDFLTIASGNYQTTIGGWSGTTDSDIDGLLSGSTFGSIMRVAPNGHFVVALQDNDNADTFSVVSGGGNYQTDTTYDTLAFTVNAVGTTQAAGSVQGGNQFQNGGNGGNLIARVPGGAVSQQSAVSFWGTFYNYSADTGPRRTADISSGYSTGVWGTEFMAFGVGGATDSANKTSERVRIKAGAVLERGLSHGTTGRLVGSKTLSSSGVWYDIARVGHSNALCCKGLLTNSGGAGSSGNAAAQVTINTLYGNPQTEESHQHYSPSNGNITNLEFRYLNTGGSVSYIIQARGTFTATNPKLHFVIDGVYSDTEPYII